jgi:hypothetical protein
MKNNTSKHPTPTPNQTQVMQTQIMEKKNEKEDTKRVFFNVNYVYGQVSPTSRK